MSRILVVEDDPAILRGLADSLRRESYEVLTAADGESAWCQIEQKPPDLVVLDLMLPKLSGYEVCRKMRGKGLNTPILMLSARGQEGHLLRRGPAPSRATLETAHPAALLLCLRPVQSDRENQAALRSFHEHEQLSP